MSQRYFPISAIALLIVMLLCLSNVSAEEGSIKDVAWLEKQVLELKWQGRYKDAIPLAQRALEVTEKVRGRDSHDTLVALRNLAMLYYAIDDYTQAVRLLERVQQSEENMSSSTIPTLGYIDSMRQIYMSERDSMPERKPNVDVNVSLSLTATDPRAKALGLTAVLQYKGRVLSTRARRRGALILPDPLIADLTQEYSAMIFRGLGDLPRNEFQQQMARVNYMQRLAIVTSMLMRLPKYPTTLLHPLEKDSNPSYVDSERVQKFLPANGVLVEWFHYRPFDAKAVEETARWGAPHYAAYVLKPTGDVVAFDLGAAQPIDDLVTKLREALKNATSGPIYGEAAKNLFDKLIKPLDIHLTQSEQLLLSPDGALSLIPFSALLDKDGRYLIQRYEITYLIGGSDLLGMTDKSIARDGPVVVASPNYGTSRTAPVAPSLNVRLPPELDRSGLKFLPLDGVAAEGAALGLLLKLDDTHVLTGNNATETRLMGLHGPKILHLATHGFFLPYDQVAERSIISRDIESRVRDDPFFQKLAKNPLLYSGLALAGANTRGSGKSNGRIPTAAEFSLKRELGEYDDGILTAAEFARLDLAGTQLVVLSACDTGMGEIQQGEGVNGLRRAVMLAGAETQVVSLWKVDDEATKLLMKDYYTHLYKGEGRSEALRSAQLTRMAASDHQHPSFWGAFIPIGDWKPLY